MREGENKQCLIFWGSANIGQQGETFERLVHTYLLLMMRDD